MSMTETKCDCKGSRHDHDDVPYYGNHHSGGGGCNDHKHCGCHGKPIHCPPFDLCTDRLRNRLAHLGGNLGFELHRYIGCKVSIQEMCGDALHTLEGKICGVGGSLVHLKVKSGTTHHIVSIPINHICKITWLNSNCNPCHHGCKCNCHADFGD